MVYEYDKCDRSLGAGVPFCAYYGNKFPMLVPSDPEIVPAEIPLLLFCLLSRVMCWPLSQWADGLSLTLSRRPLRELHDL